MSLARANYNKTPKIRDRLKNYMKSVLKVKNTK